ncbi:hypothetical protein EUGRSUZ_I02466 [Eucalyptus grandis]|uniref:Uncharacterized protein n=2 Tax=Eucalyptus grandis TaxID=71139 RepID=A0ACC3JIC6_EUCGR|nr:hypothetical protein EUGRSUZ_I02466 [Eucalyptus grandis]
MGKGGGCVPSKKKLSGVAADGERDSVPIPVEVEVEVEVEDQVQEAEPKAAPGVAKLRVFIVFYSMYGHVEALAKRMKKGVDGVDGVEGVLYRVPETLSPEALEKMKAPPKDEAVPVIGAGELVEADAVLFGFPTRYGCMGRADEGLLRRHWPAVEGAEARRQAGRVLRGHGHSGRRAGDDCLDCNHPVGSPWDAVCSDWVHFWCRYV